MNLLKSSFVSAAACLALSAGSAHALTVAASNSATALANALGGVGVTISNATLSAASLTGAGTFAGALGAIGIDSGVLLTTGTVDCAPGPNDQTGCTGPGTTTSLQFDFTTITGNIFFKYVFASEEYNEFVNSQFNDKFVLLLNGVNIALLPNGDAVTINNVNLGKNAAFYRNNTAPNSLNLDTQYDGLTTVLTASATGLVGLNHFEFLIQDVGDASLDSGVFLQGGSFASINPAPEPETMALLALGLIGLGAARRRKQ